MLLTLFIFFVLYNKYSAFICIDKCNKLSSTVHTNVTLFLRRDLNKR